MSTLRKAPLRLGLISVTVKVQGAIDTSNETTFHTVCDKGHDPARVKQRLACPLCQNDDRDTFRKAQETDDGRYIVVSAEDLKKATEVAPEVKDAINLSAHPAEELSFALPGEKLYYLAPNKGEEDTYALMVQLVTNRPDVALCSAFAVRSKPAMYRLGVHDGALTLMEFAWPDSIREAPTNDGTVDEAMAKMAQSFVDTIIEPFDSANYVDSRVESIKKLLAKQKAVAAGDAEEVTSGAPNDLMAAMEAAVSAKKKPAKKAAKKAKKKAS